MQTTTATAATTLIARPVLPIIVPAAPADLSIAQQKAWVEGYMAAAADALKYPGNSYESGYACGMASRKSNRA